MLVFNIEKFEKHSARPGSSVDVTNLVKTFTKLGFDVQLHENQTRKQMLNTLKKGIIAFDKKGFWAPIL